MPKPLLIKEMAEQERPRERMLRLGPKALSNAELLAIILGTGVRGESALHLADRLLTRFGDVRGLLELSTDELQKEPGIGIAKACQLAAISEFAVRIAESRLPGTVIRQPRDLAVLLMPYFQQLTQEEFVVVLLDTKNKVISRQTVFRGSLNASIVHPREVFKYAIRHSAAAVLVAHNHPSGDPTPSREDIDVTRRLVEAGKIVGIEVLDHVVFGDGKTVSMKEKGIV
ncbi:MAG TPA: DNA repair protein RadC [Firmicutes bacterium]|jgi:DNA repair protein RadC|nr:DNA repair protein RadC [Bacillota bacterium]